jgi:hypothetical protein
MRLWGFVSATCYYHQHLLAGLRVGDISGAIQAITTYGLSHGSQETLDAIVAMTQITKKGRSWQEFVNSVSAVRTVMDRETDPDWQIGSKVLPGFVMRAMDGDPRFAVDLTLLHRTIPAPDLDHIMATLGVKARTMGPATTLAGHVADPHPAGTPPAATEMCRAFQDGKCRFDKPEYGRWCKHSHGAALDRQRALDKKAYKAKAKPRVAPDATKAAAAAAAATTAKATAAKKASKPATDACFVCGSKNHGIDDCTEDRSDKVRGLLGEVPPAPPPAIDMALMADAIALALHRRAESSVEQEGATGLAADPLGIGSANALMDLQLAKLFNTNGANI